MLGRFQLTQNLIKFEPLKRHAMINYKIHEKLKNKNGASEGTRTPEYRNHNPGP